MDLFSKLFSQSKATAQMSMKKRSMILMPKTETINGKEYKLSPFGPWDDKKRAAHAAQLALEDGYRGREIIEKNGMYYLYIR